MASLTMLASFDGTNGGYPYAGLVADAAGNLFGTTSQGGAYGDGTLFEIAKTSTGYASTPTTLVSFDDTSGAAPRTGLIIDAAGNLFGTTSEGGTNNDGTAFELAKSSTGYASTPIVLVSFTNTNAGGLIADAAGDLFGTTGYGSTTEGDIFEITKTPGSHAGTPTILASLDGTNGFNPVGSLIADAAGNLFGTSAWGGVSNDGAVFEIAKTAGGYASTATLLASFDGSNGAIPTAGLVADAAGNLFGTTSQGGAYGDGTVFEIAKTDGGYASSPTTLVNFGGADGIDPDAALLVDSVGNLFGTTYLGGANGAGTVFEIAKTSGSYASTPTTLVSLKSKTGGMPMGGLIVDSAGNLYGTAGGGVGGQGTVFELTDTGYVPPPLPDPTVSTVTATPADGILGLGQTATITLGMHESFTVSGGTPTLLLNDGGMASYTSGSGTAALTFSYTVAAGQNTPDLTVVGSALNGATIVDAAGNAADFSGAVANPAGILKIDTTNPPPAGDIAVFDTTIAQLITASCQAYVGPVSGLQNEYVNISTDSLNISVTAPDAFVHGGSGNDAIAVTSGNNVLDGGTGSNFLTGGSGTDTFFVDDRAAPADIWSTVNGFHAGDAATVWGVTPQDFTLTWVDGQGAVGYTGLTLHATAPGVPSASLTLVGFSQADLSNGRLSVAFGSVSGNAYMYIYDNS
jgi:uncharacterized repeat protein (TIGR03803 family)